MKVAVTDYFRKQIQKKKLFNVELPEDFALSRLDEANGAALTRAFS